MLALETELVQEKVFNTVVKPFFELAIKSLGADVSNRLDRLATAFDDKLRVFKDELDNEVKLQRVVRGGHDVIESVLDELSQSEEATATAQEATNPPAKNYQECCTECTSETMQSKDVIHQIFPSAT